MRKKISVLALASMFVASSAMASGWRIPEQSVDSTAKAGANIASATRADAAYYNPANMSWMEDTWHTEIDLTYIYLSAIDYEDARSPAYDHESETEHFFVPTGFLVSPEFAGFRFGFALTAPYGLAKRWDEGYGSAYSEEFSLVTYEANPTLSYNIGDMVSIAGGVRMMYADAVADADASYIGVPLSRNMEGDTVEWGWNLALDVKPMEALNLAVTYRSLIELDFEENVPTNLMGTMVNPVGSVTIPCPAVLAFSVAYDVLDNLNVELTYDRTFWSEYEELDFDFSPAYPGNPYEAAVVRDWDDTNAFRIGVTYGVTEAMDLMVGFGYDENPIADDANVDFSIPDSDAWLYSAGMQYAVSDAMELGIACLYDYKEERENKVDPTGSVYGEFTNASAFLVTVGMTYKF